MKQLFLAITGATVAWLILGFFLNDFSMDELLILIVGIALGYAVRKPPEGAEEES